MIHLTLQQFSAFLDREMSDSSRALVEDHLAVCDTCSGKLERLERQERDLVRILTHDPGDEFFTRFTAGLQERIELKPAADAPPRVEPVPVAPAAPAPMEPSRSPRRQGPAFPWAAAIVIFAIAGSIGAMSIGSEFASRWLSRSRSGDVRPLSHFTASQPPDTTDPAPGFTPSAASTVGGALSAAVAPSAAAPPAPAPPFPVAAHPPGAAPNPHAPAASAQSAASGDAPAPAAKDDDVVWRPDPEEPDDSSSDKASSDSPSPSTAAEYDAVATKLERSLPMLQGDDYRQARFQLAEARYNAWRLEPNSDRTQVVTRAIHAYLIGAPVGSDRETAEGWLSEIQASGY